MNLSPAFSWRALSLAAAVSLGALMAQAESFALARRPIEIAERGVLMETVLSTTNRDFSFLPPPGWSMTVNTNEGRVTWLWQDLSSTINLRLYSGLSAPTGGQREDILRRFPEAKIHGESVCYTSGHQGRAFDLECTVQGGYVRETRLAWVCYGGGVVEIELTCASEFFPRHQQVFNELLNSFRITARGEK